MITLVEALNYRCLRYVQTTLKPFNVLVGPNASGKTTFLDVIGFLSDLVSSGPDIAVIKRAPDPRDLLFGGRGDRFEMAIEAKIPDKLRESTSRPDLGIIRYQISIGSDDTQRQFEIKEETLLLKAETILLMETAKLEPGQRPFFESANAPSELNVPKSLQIRRSENKIIVNKVFGGNDNFYSELYEPPMVCGPGLRPSRKVWSFKFGSKKSALGNLFDDTDSFPVATWFRSYLTEGIRRVMLNSLQIRRPSPPVCSSGFLSDGSNLPWAVARLRKEHPERHVDWVAHLGTALPDLVDITTTERPEDRHCYMNYEYRGGYKVPSWLVSDSTLRLTALTLPAYLADFKGTYLIEKPENGIYPLAVPAVCDSLYSLYGSQVLVVTHSPVMLNSVNTDDILCFTKDEEGSTNIFLVSDHPLLSLWNHEVDLGTLFGSGVLG